MSHSPEKALFQGALRLVLGTGAAQVLTLVAVPFLTRLYLPEYFGVFGVYFAASTLGAVLVTARYDCAIPLAEDGATGWSLLRLSLTLGLIGSLLAAGILFVAAALGWHHAQGIMLYLPLGLFLLVGVNSSEYWLNRSDRFSHVAISRFVGALVMLGLQLILGWKGHLEWGLVWGMWAGLTATNVLNLYFSYGKKPSGPFPSLVETARRFQRMPKFLLPAQFCNSAANHVPTLVFASGFGAAIAGTYTVANRALSVLDLITTAVSQAFYPYVAREYLAGRNCIPILKSTIRRLFFIALPIFPILFVWAPDIAEIFFGPNWRESGVIMRWLLPMFFLRFLFAPCGHVPVVTGRQEYTLYRQIVLFLLVAIALGAGRMAGSFNLTLALYSFVYSLAYIVDTYLAIKLLKPNSSTTK